MKIQGRKGQSIQSMGPIQLPATQESGPAAQAEETLRLDDSVELQSSAQVRQLAQAVQAMPTVRTEKVDGLRDAIEEGSYYVESDKLARRVVEETLRDALAGQGRPRKT